MACKIIGCSSKEIGLFLSEAMFKTNFSKYSQFCPTHARARQKEDAKNFKLKMEELEQEEEDRKNNGS